MGTTPTDIVINVTQSFSVPVFLRCDVIYYLCITAQAAALMAARSLANISNSTPASSAS